MVIIPEVVVWLVAGLGLGVLLAGLQGHPRRSVGLVPWGATGLALALGVVALWPANWLYLPVGALAGVVLGALVRLLLDRLALPSLAQRVLRLVLLPLLAVGIVGALFWGMPGLAPWLLEESPAPGLAALLAAAGAALAWWLLYAPALEQLMEVILWPIYRIRGWGPGLANMPRTGPVIVLANHSSWLDPLWLGKVVPRRLFPMMTSGFYDLPGLRWLMRHVVGAIRVSNAPLRREVPELNEAVRILDNGGCLVIFPEGRMRRTTEKLVHPFGQGIWLILKERPATPVVPCWIEGGWGSFCSYCNGKPTKNKRFDFWRSIRIGACAPEVVDRELVEDRQATRRYLMQRCLAARQYLGLEPGEPPKVEETGTLVEETEDVG